MSVRGRESLLIVCAALVALIAMVAFVKVMLSAMVAAFVAGLGMGALGVISVSRLTPQDRV